MIKDVFTLSKNSYHVKMMKYIWNLNYYDFSHMCPYWWLSVVNHIIFIPFFLVREFLKLLKWGLKIIGKGIWGFLSFIWSLVIMWEEKQAKLHEQRQAKLWEKRIQYYKEHPEELAEESVMQRIGKKIQKFHYFEWQALQDQVLQTKWAKEAELAKQVAAIKINKLKQEFIAICNDANKDELLQSEDGWINYLSNYKEQKKQSEIELEAAKRRAAKARINKILKIVKPILTFLAYTVGTIAGLIACYYLIRFFVWCWQGISRTKINIDWHNVWHYTKIGLGWAGICIAIALLVFGVIRLFKIYRIKHPRSYKHKPYTTPILIKIINAIADAIVWFFKKLAWPFIKIGNAFQFVVSMIKNECPAIKWKD
jgi:hypothetical protein